MSCWTESKKEKLQYYLQRMPRRQALARRPSKHM